MRRVLRCAFVTLLAFALSASGATLGLAHIAPAKALAHGHHGAAHAEHAHHDHHGMTHSRPDEGKPPAEHPSKNCCSACTVMSPLPYAPDTRVELVVSRAVYLSLERLDVSVVLRIDPGIPIRIG